MTPTLPINAGPTLVVLRADLARVPGLEQALTNRLTIPNPDWRPGSREPEFLRYYEIVGNDAYLRMPRGASVMVATVCRLHQIEAKWNARALVSRTRGTTPAAKVDPELRDYQLEAIQRLHADVQGVVEMPTGAGKTRTGAAALVALGESGVVFVHTQDLLDQWVGAFKALGRTVRVVAGLAASDWSPLAPGEIAVAMIQTVAQNLTRALTLLTSAGCVAFDECHHVPAGTWRNIANVCPGRYRWGFSATKSEDGGGLFVDLLIGPTIYKVHTRDLIARGYLRSPAILPVATGWGPTLRDYYATVPCAGCGRSLKTTYAKLQAGQKCRAKIPSKGNKPCNTTLNVADAEIDRLNYTDAQTNVANDAGIQDMVVALTETAVNVGRTVLVLAPRREAVASITERLRARGINAIAATSSMPKGARREAIEKMRSRSAQVLVATTLADEGLDIPSLDFGVNLMSGKKQGRAKQRTGRLLRLEGQDPILVEMVNAGEYLKQWEGRRDGYRKEYGRQSVLSNDPLSVTDAIALIQRRSLPPARTAAEKAGF